MKYRILSGFIVFSILMGSSCVVHAKGGTSTQLVIYQQSSWKGCKKPRMVMVYRLKTSSQSSYYHDYKMKFSDRKMGITMYYNKPGLYSYYVSQNCHSHYKGMKYDRNRYHVRVMVRYANGQLLAESELPVNKRGFKEESMTFHNSYHKKKPKNPSKQVPHKKENPIPKKLQEYPPNKEKQKHKHKNSIPNHQKEYPPEKGHHSQNNPLTTHKVKTGDNTDIKLYVIGMMSSFIILLLCIALEKRKKEKDDENQKVKS